MADQHYDGPAIQINPASGYATEMRKWESTFTQFGPPGRQWQYEEYPRQMFLAGHPGGRPGKIEITDWRMAMTDAERTALEQTGYDADQAQAITKQQARDTEMARAAAESTFADRRLSAAAQAERDEVEAATAGHMAEMPRSNPKTGKRLLG